MTVARLRRWFQAGEMNGRCPVGFIPMKWLTKSDA
jgi:hypothetical protein